ncbi:MAG: hypothetical protein MJY96_08080 [Bacteroidaceae bacterium]|nr:hypothetical protein [Bacteroidaceae bacterium]
MITELQDFIEQLFDGNEERIRRIVNKLPPADIDDVEQDILIRFILKAPFLFVSEGIYNIEGGSALCEGKVTLGTISVNEEVTIIRHDGSIVKTKVTAIEMFKKLLEQTEAGDECRLLFEDLPVDEMYDFHIIIRTADYPSLQNPVIGDYVEEEELEYLKEYREMSAEGPISDRDRRYLEKIKEANGISDERAAELEAMA